LREQGGNRHCSHPDQASCCLHDFPFTALASTFVAYLPGAPNHPYLILSAEAANAGVVATKGYIDYFLR
jgi:hypothetical protein